MGLWRKIKEMYSLRRKCVTVSPASNTVKSSVTPFSSINPAYPPFPLCCHGVAIPMATACLCGWPRAPTVEDSLNLSLHIPFKLPCRQIIHGQIWSLFFALRLNIHPMPLPALPL